MKTTTIRRFRLGLVLLTCGLSLTVLGQDRIPIESLEPDKKLFSIGVFSDNKGGHTNLTETLKVFRNRINTQCIIGVGDHFNNEVQVQSMEKSAIAAYGSTDAFYDIFYPVIGDNEDRILPDHGGKPDGAFKWGWFERCKIAKRDGTILRDSIKKYESTHGDYYAVLEENGLRIHLVALYFPDTMGKLFPESLTFGESTCKMIKQKYPNEPMIVVAHNGAWWEKQKIPESSPIFEADIIMEASTHHYIVREDVPGKSLTFNTSQVHSSWRGHVFEIRVFRDGFVLLALEHPKCLMAPMELDEWRKVWVKPFGKKPYPVLDWDEIRSIAPEILPPVKDGFNCERALLHGFARKYKEMPSFGEIEEELRSKDPEKSAVALLGLGYSKDGGKASELLKEYLPGQKDLGIQAQAVIALLRTHPQIAVPLLQVLIDIGRDSMLTREDLRAVARQENCPDKTRILTNLARGRGDTTAYFAVDAMAREFNGDELKASIAVFIEALENEKRSRCWVSAATALMKLGSEAKPALPVLIKRIDCRSRDVQWRVIKAVGSIGGPEARKAVPKLKQQLKSPDPGVRRVTEETLQDLAP